MKFCNIEKLLKIPMWNGSTEFDLDTPRRVAHLLGDPQDCVPTIHVAGTNGKGSVAAMIASMMFADSRQVGLATSPHLSDVTERCSVNGCPVDRSVFDDALGDVLDAASQACLKPTFFETVTLASFLTFKRLNLDVSVIEVGLGGRLDATNILKKPLVSVITGIALDHTHILGDTLEKIALEKCGIIKGGVPLVVGLVEPQVREVIRDKANQIQAPVFFYGEDFEVSYDQTTLNLGKVSVALDGINFALAGEHQLRNAAVAAYAALKGGCSEEAISKGLSLVRWPGRLEMLRDVWSCDVLLDGAHNPAGMATLLCYVGELLRGKRACEEVGNGAGSCCSKYSKLTFVLSFVAQKDWQTMLRMVSEFVEELQNSDLLLSLKFIFTSSGHHRAVEPELLADEFKSYEYVSHGRYEVSVEHDPELLFKSGEVSRREDELWVVSGSLFLLGVVRPMLVSNFRTIEI